MGSAFLATALILGTAILSAVLVPASGALARRVRIMDQPGPRKVHRVPTPRLGGLAVYLSFVIVVWAGYALLPFLTDTPWIPQHLAPTLAVLRDAHRVAGKLLAVMIGASIAFGVGLLDDVLGRRFPVGAKAAGQLLAAAVLVSAGVTTSFLPEPWMNGAVTLLWVVGVTNAFNLLDNMDGLSAGVAFVASAVLLVNAWSLGELFIGLFLVAFMGSLLGFLFFNFHPARIFLGDCGSLFIGFVMAAITLLQGYVSKASSTYFPILMPVVVLAVPLMDTATVVVIRIREGRPIYVGDARHLSHRLVSLGFSQRATVLFLYLVTLCLGLGAASLTDATPWQTALILLQTLGLVALILILLFFERRREDRRVLPVDR
jgi:UDP-GlcNAc:undecaprenyl-phosphate/decaprenyl-phosphate GlcNAc-1-phosphate transferase